jgi:type IV fimbrial biogenesis protein FimT
MRTRENGFTIIELMTSLAVLAILFGFAAPTFRQYTGNNRATAAQNDFATSLNLARSEALKRSTPTTVCASVNGLACAAGATWASGWIAFVDGTGTRGVIDPLDEVIQRWPGVEGNVLFDVTPGGSGVTRYVTFAADGMNGAEENFEMDIRWAECGGDRRLSTRISPVGMITALRETC